MYKGLTIILDKPSRFDYDSGRLISGRAGDWFTGLLSPYTRIDIDIRLLDATQPFKEGTTTVLLLGNDSLNRFKPHDNGTLLKMTHHRGSPFKLDNDITFIPTFTPQETFDRIDYEKQDTNQPKDKDEIGEDKESEKDYQRTQRKNWKFWHEQDVRKAIRISSHAGHLREYPPVTYRIYPPLAEVLRVLSSSDKSIGAEQSLMVVDIETDENHNINCIGLLPTTNTTLKEALEHDQPNNPLTAYVVPFKRYNNSLAYDKLEFCKFLRVLCKVFANPKTLVITHNGGFDLFVLAYKYLVPYSRNNFDTMLGHHRNYPEVEKSLGHVVSLYTDLPYHKDEGVFDPKTYEQEQRCWVYNGKDLSSTLFTYYGLVENLAKHGTSESATQSCRSLRPYLTMQYEGMRLDTDYMIKLADKLEAKFNHLTRVLRLLTGNLTINPRSSQQVSKYLYETLRLPKPVKDPTKEETLLKLYARFNVPSLRVILAAREAGKLRSSLKFQLWRSNRLTTNLKIAGTDTFRAASSALLKFRNYKGYGTNTQNFSKKIRRIVVADEGMMLGQTDQAGAEALVVAYECTDEKFRQLFKLGIKPHVYVGMQIAADYWAERLGIPTIEEYIRTPIHELKALKHWADLEKLIKDSDNNPEPRYRYYYIGKTMCHSLNYDASPAMYQLTALIKSEGALRLTIGEATKYHSLYRYKLFPEITGWHCYITNELDRNNRTLKNLFGFPRKFGETWSRDLFKQAYAFGPQSTVGCITHIAFTRLSELIDQAKTGDLMDGVSLLQNGHDSILWQAPKGKVLEVAKVVKHELEIELTSHRGEKFRMGSGTSIGTNWCPKDKRNENGLEEIRL